VTHAAGAALGRALGLAWLVLVAARSAVAQEPPPAAAAAPPAAPQPTAAPAGAEAPAPDSPPASDSPAPLLPPPPPAAAVIDEKALGRKPVPPPLPPPSAAQVDALRALEAEAAEYEKSARDYRATLTLVVRHHYEEQRRRILAALDGDIKEETRVLDVARAEAIRRLEQFVALYSGERAHPEATPDAMFRLAALYDERARSELDGELSQTLKPAIALYHTILREFPGYAELASVAYYLGHAYTDSNRLDEGQQAWRHLVCKNRYGLVSDANDPEKIVVDALPQDHDEKFWSDWYNRHPVPLDQGAKVAAGPLIDREEISFKDPYLECQALAQNTPPGQEPRYVAEVWWQLGNYHFDLLDKGGPYALNRATSAYEHALTLKKPPLYGVAMYKRAWTYFKQQRFHTAVDAFVALLRYADEQERLTGDPGADFRSEAYTYIAGSLTYVDFEGPPAHDPFIPRNDVLDVELDPVVAEEKMRVAITRVQDPRLIPQNAKWTVEIYKALAQEFIEITQNRNAIAMVELTLDRFPMDRDAPSLQDKAAGLYDQVSRLAPDGSAVREEYARLALEARTKLAAYVGATAWTNANRDDPEALQQAEELVRRGLQRAAAEYTNQARALVGRAKEASNESEQRDLLERAIRGYRMADTGWNAYIEQDPAALDSYESRFWLADARYWTVVLQSALGRSPGEAEVAAARHAAMDVRDSNEDDRYLQPAAYYVVSIADNQLEDRYRDFAASKGARSFPRRDAVEFAGVGAERKPIRAQLPPEVQNAIASRDEYNKSIAFETDPQKNGRLYAFQAADFLFVYGHFDEARARLEPMMAAHCGKDEWGYKAWEKLISMSNFEGDGDRSRALVEGKSCAFDEETLAAEDALRKPVRQGVAYLDARKVYDEAEKMSGGPERDKKWRQAAAAYNVALDAAPDRDEAPEAAMNGAFAYKQVGEYDKAIEMYELFISRYGNDKKLFALRDGDTSAEPPAEPDVPKYQDRVRYLKLAYDALASSYVLFFDYPKASSTFDKIGKNQHFSAAERRDAARQSLTLAASLGDTSRMQAARSEFAALQATPEQLAEADFVVASAALKGWDQLSPDSGANKNARIRAERAMGDYYAQNANNAAAAQYAVEAAYWSAKLKRAARDGRGEAAWWEATKAAFERYKAIAPKRADGFSQALGSRQASFAAEGAYTLIDEEMRKSYDYETGHHRYAGTTVEVLGQYRKGAGEAQKFYDQLQATIDAYASPEWATAAIARQGSLYDSLRTALYNTQPPALKMFDKRTEALLSRAENSDNLDLQEQADNVRMKVQTAWQEARDRELESADQVMVDRYGNAITLARRYNVSNPAVVRAIQRLAFFTDVIGEAKLAQYTGRVQGLGYSPGMFLRIRPGLVTAPEAEGLTPPEPLPLESSPP
jgi:hypothetical protein